MNAVAFDLRTSLRSLVRRPAFSAAAILILALGLGANVTIFSIVRGTLLRPLDYPHADRLAIVWADFGEDGQSLPAVNGQDFRDYRRMAEVFEDFAAATGARVAGLTGVVTDDAGRPGLIDVAPVSANFFRVLGVDPLMGRHFGPADEALEAPRTAILGHRAWQERFGGAPDVLGETLEIDGYRHEIVGVLPADFRLHLPAEAFLLRHAEVWTALQWDYDHQERPRNFTTFTAFGLLRPGATFEQGQTEMDRMARVLRERHPEHEAADLRLRAVPLQEDVTKGVGPALWALQGAVGFMLLIVCANVANLLLVRGASRRRELSVRAALGAGGGTLLRPLLLEAALLTAGGAVLGTALGAVALRVLSRWPPADLPRWTDVRLDLGVVAFTVALAGAATVLAALAPALATRRLDIVAALRGSRGSSGGRHDGILRESLVHLQVVLSAVLLVGVGLTARSAAELANADPGFDSENLLTFRAQLPGSEYPDRETHRAFVRILEERVLAIPGVESFASISQLPLTGSGALQPYAWNEETARNWESITADGRWVTPGFFETMGIRLLAGREFRSDDIEGPPRIVVDRTLAERVWPGEPAVGRQLQIDPVEAEEPFAEVVGVVEHVRMHDLSRPLQSQIYQPAVWFARASWVVRTDGRRGLDAIRADLEAAVREVDPGLPVTSIRAVEDLVHGATAPARLHRTALGVFGGVAVFLTALGIASAISLSVLERSREIAIRLALGDRRGRLLVRLLVRWAGAVALASAAGIGLAAILGSRFTDLLHRVEPTDPGVLGGAAVAMVLVALAAGVSPARRVVRLDLAAVLRGD